MWRVLSTALLIESALAYSAFPMFGSFGQKRADRFSREQRAAQSSPLQKPVESIWFPVTKHDLDYISQSSEDGGKLSSDHPGFHDSVYRARRRMIADKALQYRYGQPLPTVNYTQSELQTWSTVYERLRAASRQHAVDEYTKTVDEMERKSVFLSLIHISEPTRPY